MLNRQRPFCAIAFASSRRAHADADQRSARERAHRCAFTILFVDRVLERRRVDTVIGVALRAQQHGEVAHKFGTAILRNRLQDMSRTPRKSNMSAMR